MLKDLEQRQKDLENLIARKNQELQNLENLRTQVLTELVRLQGKLDMIKELIASERNREKSKN